MWGINVFIMQIDYVKISCKEDVHICHTNFAKQMERNLHEITSRWKTYGKRLFSEDLEVRDVVLAMVVEVRIYAYEVLNVEALSVLEIRGWILALYKAPIARFLDC
jgi:hypothetical protein